MNSSIAKYKREASVAASYLVLVALVTIAAPTFLQVANIRDLAMNNAVGADRRSRNDTRDSDWRDRHLSWLRNSRSVHTWQARYLNQDCQSYFSCRSSWQPVRQWEL